MYRAILVPISYREDRPIARSVESERMQEHISPRLAISAKQESSPTQMDLWSARGVIPGTTSLVWVPKSATSAMLGTLQVVWGVLRAHVVPRVTFLSPIVHSVGSAQLAHMRTPSPTPVMHVPLESTRPRRDQLRAYLAKWVNSRTPLALKSVSDVLRGPTSLEQALRPVTHAAMGPLQEHQPPNCVRHARMDTFPIRKTTALNVLPVMVERTH